MSYDISVSTVDAADEHDWKPFVVARLYGQWCSLAVIGAIRVNLP
jgi:hypothetical protein